jgi:hypothetical protein
MVLLEPILSYLDTAWPKYLGGQGKGGEDSLKRISVLFSFSMRANSDRFSQFQLKYVNKIPAMVMNVLIFL